MPLIELKTLTNLFYYNIFRFERFTQDLLAYPFYKALNSVGIGSVIARRSGKADWDVYLRNVLSDPKGGFSVISAGNHIAILCGAIALSALNFLCFLFEVKAEKIWVTGLIFAMILAFVASLYIGSSDSRRYIKDFERFEAMAMWKKRLSALATFLLILAIWFICILSFIIYLPFTLS